MEKEIFGYVHSVETFGALDGPGIRYVLFLQGCPLSCLYCHNPDAIAAGAGMKRTVEEIIEEVLKYKNFLKGGGITLSGGEPLLQYEFCEALIDRAHSENIHVAIDTSGAIPLSLCRAAVEKADLLLLDIKAISPELCLRITGKDNSSALEILNFREKIGKPLWIRHVLLPGYTTSEFELISMAEYLRGYKQIERIELLPFHKMGEYKWEEIGRKYELFDTPTPTLEQEEAARKIFKARKLPIK